MQNNESINLINLKTYLKYKLFENWCEKNENEMNPSFRAKIMGYDESKLKSRIDVS